MKNSQTQEASPTPEWAEQFSAGVSRTFEKLIERIEGSTPVAQPPFDQRPVDRSKLTTEKEQEEYLRAVDQVFVKLDPKTKRFDGTEDRYRVIHVSPEWQTSNPAEYIAKFSIEKFHNGVDTEGKPIKKIITAFNITAKDFMLQYTPERVVVTAADPVLA